MKLFFRPAVISFAAALCISILAFFIGLGNEAYWDYDEAAYAHVTDQMELTEDFLTMHYGGERWIDKPPMYFWLAYTARTLFGNNEFATRIPSAVGGVLCVVLVWLLVVEITKKHFAGFFASAVLISTGAFLEVGRQVRLDTLVTATILGAWYFFIKGKQKPVYYLGVGVCIGLGVMTKNVVGLLGLLPIIIEVVITRDFSILKSKYIWLSAVLAFLVLLPWHLYEAFLFGNVFWSSYIFTHVIERYGTNIFNNEASLAGIVRYVYLFSMPWLFVLFATSIITFIKKKYIEKETLLYYMVALISFLGIFILFATSQTKAVTYFTPIYPFIAVAIGIFVGSLFVKKNYIFLILFIVVAIPTAIDAGFHTNNYFAYDRDIAEEEKIIGLITRESNLPIYFTEVSYWESIRVYSGRQGLDTFNNKVAPYYLIAQNRSLPTIEIPLQAKMIYQGKLLTTFIVQ